MTEDYGYLVEQATALAETVKLTEECTVGAVGCALVTDGGNVYTGVSIDCGCGIGFCGEHSAVASMVTHGESKIRAIVAVVDGGRSFRRAVDVGNSCTRSTERICAPR